jgi:putative ATP-binding cassette transporter
LIHSKEHLSKQTIHYFKESIKDLFFSKRGSRAARLTIMLCSLLIVFNALNVYNSYIGRDFISSIEKSDFAKFIFYAFLYSTVFIISSGVGAIYRYSEESLGILWREHLTRSFTERYLDRRSYHYLANDFSLPNPDQRITEDVKAFTTTTLSFLLLFIGSLITTVLFSGVLWTINPILFLVAVGYAIFGSYITIQVGTPLIHLNYNQLDLEATFRADLVHIRENTEQLAISHNEIRFSHRLGLKLNRLAHNIKKIIGVNLRLVFVTNSYNYFIQIIPALIIAPSYMRGEVEFGVITQSSMAFTTLIGAFSLIVTQFQSISSFSAVISRLQQLSDSLNEIQVHFSQDHSKYVLSENLFFRKVTIINHDTKKLIVKDLSLNLVTSERLLISTSEDTQKLAIFRTTARIWQPESGTIGRPETDQMIFLSERPYLPPGTLRTILTSFDQSLETSDQEIIHVLELLRLGLTLKRIGSLIEDLDWHDELSIEEQHLIAVARVIIAKPKFVFMDRPSSTLAKVEIENILKLFREKEIGTIILSKGDESKFRYDKHLEIFSDGTWKITTS